MTIPPSSSALARSAGAQRVRTASIAVRRSSSGLPLNANNGRCNTSLLKQLHRRRLEARHRCDETRQRSHGWHYDHVPAKWTWSYWSSHSGTQSHRYQLVDGQWTNLEDGSAVPSSSRAAKRISAMEQRVQELKQKMEDPIDTIFSPVAMQSGFGGLFEEARKMSSDIISSMAADVPKPAGGWIDPVRKALEEYPARREIDPITNRRRDAAYPRAVEWDHAEASIGGNLSVVTEMIRRGYATVGEHPDRATIDQHIEATNANPKDPYSKKPQGMQTSFAKETVHGVDGATLSEQILQSTIIPETKIDIHGYTKKPQGMQTQFKKEHPETLENELNAAQEADPQPQFDRHGYDFVPTGLQTSFEAERGTPSGNVTFESKDSYSNVPQGLQTSFAKEDGLPDFVVPDSYPQGQAPAAEPIEQAEFSPLDSYSKKPQGLETAFAQEVKSNEPTLEEQIASEHSLQQTVEPVAEPIFNDAYSKAPQGLQTSFAKEASSGEPVLTEAQLESQASSEPCPVESALSHFEGENPAAYTCPDKAESTSLEADLLEKLRISDEAIASGAVDAETTETYKIVALESKDGSESKVVIGDLKYKPSEHSSASPILSPPEALPKLSAPLKFLAQIEKLNADGWGIMYAENDILIFKKMPQTIIENLQKEASEAEL